MLLLFIAAVVGSPAVWSIAVAIRTADAGPHRCCRLAPLVLCSGEGKGSGGLMAAALRKFRLLDAVPEAQFELQVTASAAAAAAIQGTAGGSSAAAQPAVAGVPPSPPSRSNNNAGTGSACDHRFQDSCEPCSLCPAASWGRSRR